MSPLESLGWSPWFTEPFAAHAAAGLEPARVSVAYNHLYGVLTGSRDLPARLAGRLRHEATGPGDLPVAGDWVAVNVDPGGGAATIRGRLPRRTEFARLAAGGSSERQVVAANVDTLFVVTGLDGDFSPRRVERYLELAWQGAAEPVVVLSKADLATGLEARRAEIGAVTIGVPVIAVSAVSGEGLEALRERVPPGRTAALVGSSGVGKSTLVNRLLGEERQATRSVRAGDDRGRHTTTRRELIRLPGGGLLLDTPGLREVGLTGEAAPAGFAEIEALAAQCGFRDCRHETEPRCRVLRALRDGELAPERLASYRKLLAEQQHAERRSDQRAQIEQKRKWRAIHKAARRHRPRE